MIQVDKLKKRLGSLYKTAEVKAMLQAVRSLGTDDHVKYHDVLVLCIIILHNLS